ncbi:hypothetical protein IW145_005681, partial [Coemansia sp. RSA 521]
ALLFQLLNDELPALPHGLAAAFWWALNPLFQLLVFDPKGLTLATDPLSNAPEFTFVEDDTGATGTIGAAVAAAKKAMVAAKMVYMAMALGFCGKEMQSSGNRCR